MPHIPNLHNLLKPAAAHPTTKKIPALVRTPSRANPFPARSGAGPRSHRTTEPHGLHRCCLASAWTAIHRANSSKPRARRLQVNKPNYTSTAHIHAHVHACMHAMLHTCTLQYLVYCSTIYFSPISFDQFYSQTPTLARTSREARCEDLTHTVSIHRVSSRIKLRHLVSLIVWISTPP